MISFRPNVALPRIVIESRHNDASGGGRYTLQLAQCFEKVGTVFFAGEPCLDAGLTNVRDLPMRRYDHDFVPDLFIAIAHNGGVKPIGNINAHVMFFPMEGNDAPRDCDWLICLNEFVELHSLLKFPEKRGKSFIVCPSLDLDQYDGASRKEKLILNVGNYFREADGHSKNQHKIIDWFAESRLFESHTLICTGFVGNREYFDRLKARETELPNLKVLESVSRAELLDLFSKAEFLIHANGFGRNNYYQTEHFGYVAIEAMAAGCQPIVHNSGGCRDLPGVRVWNHLYDLQPLMFKTDPAFLRSCAEHFSMTRMQEQVRQFWRSACSRLAA